MTWHTPQSGNGSWNTPIAGSASWQAPQTSFNGPWSSSLDGLTWAEAIMTWAEMGTITWVDLDN